LTSIVGELYNCNLVPERKINSGKKLYVTFTLIVSIKQFGNSIFKNQGSPFI